LEHLDERGSKCEDQRAFEIGVSGFVAWNLARTSDHVRTVCANTGDGKPLTPTTNMMGNRTPPSRRRTTGRGSPSRRVAPPKRRRRFAGGMRRSTRTRLLRVVILVSRVVDSGRPTSPPITTRARVLARLALSFSRRV